jgi:tetrahydrodipicolinate N-acetyltransferase
VSLNTAQEIIKFIKDSKKSTPVKAYLKGDMEGINFYSCKVFCEGNTRIIMGDWDDVKKILDENKDKIEDYYLENDRRNSAIPMLDLKDINARIEPGSVIRDKVTIGNNAIIMMGASINIGAVVGDGTMIDFNAVLGGRATVGNNCHIGAGAILAGVIEPPSADPVVVEDNVMVGANAVVLEGVRIGKGSVVAAGAIVTADVPAGVVVAGSPAKIIKNVDEKTEGKTQIMEDLRNLKK